jgi:hypothetical protein
VLNRVWLVVGQDDHVFPSVSIPLDQETRDIVDIVDATAQLTILAEVVDTNQERLALTGTV